jgi:hypothetical protein
MILAVVGLFGGLFSTASPCRAGNVKDYYLTEDSKFKEKLTLSNVSHVDNAGRVSNTNTWVIETTGEWTQTTSGINFGIVAPRPNLVAKGKLTAQQLAALAQHLATQDFNKLTPQLGLPMPNGPYRSTTIRFGKKQTTLNTLGGSLTEGMPKAGDRKADDWSRFVALTLVLQNLLVQEAPKKPEQVIREIGLRSPNGLENTGARNPTKITSAKELAKIFPDQNQLVKTVDFSKEQVLIFAWKGSSGDRLSCKVEKSKNGRPVVVFLYSVGLQEDLRTHFRCFVIAKNATWRVEDQK